MSHKEVLKEWKSWVPAIDAEVRALIEDKQALQRLSPEEFAELKIKARSLGKGIEELPSKFV